MTTPVSLFFFFLLYVKGFLSSWLYIILLHFSLAQFDLVTGIGKHALSQATMERPFLSFPWARQLSRKVQVNAGSLCDTAAKIGVRIKESLSTSVKWKDTEQHSQVGSAPVTYSARTGFNSCPCTGCDDCGINWTLN
jgi:hypothetical protein